MYCSFTNFVPGISSGYLILFVCCYPSWWMLPIYTYMTQSELIRDIWKTFITINFFSKTNVPYTPNNNNNVPKKIHKMLIFETSPSLKWDEGNKLVPVVATIEIKFWIHTLIHISPEVLKYCVVKCNVV